MWYNRGMESKEYTPAQKEDADRVRFAIAVKRIKNTSDETIERIEEAIGMIFSSNQEDQREAREFLDGLYYSKQ